MNKTKILINILLIIFIIYLLHLTINSLTLLDRLYISYFSILPSVKIGNDVKKTLKHHKVYISMTTNPERIKALPMLLPLINTEYVDEIHINIPLKYKNTEDYDENDILELKLIDKVRVFRVEKDLGPVTKILPTLRRVGDEDAIIISLDDDIAYTKSLINKLIETSIKYPNEVVGGRGYTFSSCKSNEKIRCFDIDSINEWWSSESATKPYVDIIEGFGGIAYKKRLVDCDLLEKLNEVSSNCKFSDDLTINYTLAKRGVKRRKLGWEYNKSVYPLTYGEINGISKHKAPDGYKSYNLYKVVNCLDEIKNVTSHKK